jgi:putative transposase
MRNAICPHPVPTWAKGYCVSTVGLDEEQIRKYVRWQLKKDKTMDQLELWKKR